MPERPLLILPSPGEPVDRRKQAGREGKVGLPTPERQAERIEPKFTALQRAMDAQAARLQAESPGIVPEQVLVMETVGPVKDFVRAIQRVAGMEWLGEVEEDIPSSEDFVSLTKKGQPKPEKALHGRLFLVFSNQRALTEMLSLWSRWKSGQRLSRGLGRWKHAFERLHDIRPWGVQDRLIETGVLDDWKMRLAHEDEVVPCEVELWFRGDAGARAAAQGRVAGLVAQEGGQVISQALIEQIAYHALLVQLPARSVERVIASAGRDIALAECERIQFFRAAGQMAATMPDGDLVVDTNVASLPVPQGDPVIALFDGFPLQNHERLAGRLVVDDPDDLESAYQAHERRHGTAMASVIVHGELDASDGPLARLVYVRPILKPKRCPWDPQLFLEIVPENMLTVDLLHRAVRRLYEGEGAQAGVARSVCVANLSIGIKDRLFDRALSPLAKLLDWLAWRYSILFVVSAGNHPDQIELAVPEAEFAALDGQSLQVAVLKTVERDARHRRLLSPAEAVNALTVGAVHEDKSVGAQVANAIDPYVDPGLPSPVSAQGMGYRRAVKPEVLAPGGRVLLQQRLDTRGNARFDYYGGTRPPGQRVAAPGPTPGDTSYSYYTRGTSNAAALVSRTAAALYDVLSELRRDPGGALLDTVPPAVWLKALVVHAADWGPGAETLERSLKTNANSRHFKEYMTRFLGYGAIDGQRVAECTPFRVTALSGGTLSAEQSHIHRFPLPPALSGVRGWRRLKATLAWFTPVRPSYQAWQQADLWFEPTRDPLRLRRRQADWQAVRRGTVQHEVLEGEEAAAFVDGDNLEIQVSCRSEAGTMEDQVPYALALTLEVDPDVGIPVYEEVRSRIHARIPIVPPE